MEAVSCQNSCILALLASSIVTRSKPRNHDGADLAPVASNGEYGGGGSTDVGLAAISTLL